MMGATISLMVLVIAVMMFSGLKSASANTIILQEGTDGYTGCTTRTIWGPDVAEEVDDARNLYLRGAHNRFSARSETTSYLILEKLMVS